MGHGSEKHEDMPNGMKMPLLIVSEEVCAHGVENALSNDTRQCSR